MVKRDDWIRLYSSGWSKNDLLTDESFSHPAKMAKSLAFKIVNHMIEEGWIYDGGTCLDPFAGLGTVALPLIMRGIHFVGVELEQPFVDMARGCDCTGVSKADWVRFYGRLDRVRYKDGRYICPRCVAEAKVILPAATAQVNLFEHTEECLSYRRNSGKIPATKPHRYVGNLEAWARLGLRGTAVIIQGDSRNLISMLGNMSDRGFHTAVSPPPFLAQERGGGLAKADAVYAKDGKRFGRNHGYQNQGNSPGQLAAMSDGGFNAVAGSPPYSHRLNQGNKAEGYDYRHYGGCITSPPYEGSMSPREGCGESSGAHGERNRRKNPTSERFYGRSNGQLAEDTGDTFWSASRQILSQLFLCIKPGGHAVFVVKDFVRDKKRVPFCDQWRRLCEAVGFRCVHVHRAWLVEEHGIQRRIDGEETRYVKARKSFFRRLSEAKGSPSIDWEEVQCYERVDSRTDAVMIYGRQETPHAA